MERIQESQDKLMKLFAERMDSFEGELNKGSASTASTSSLANEFADFKIFVMESLRAIQNQIELIALSTDQLEMHSRRKILLLHGIPEQKQEDTATLAVKVITDKLKLLDFTATDIRRSHRMGKASTSSRPRSILVKFCDTTTRNKVWFAKTQLKGTGITLSEFLTRKRHNLFVLVRKRCGVSRSWTRDGVIYVVDGEGTRHRIDRECDLEDITHLISPSSSAQQLTVRPAIKETAAGPRTRRTAAVTKR